MLECTHSTYCAIKISINQFSLTLRLWSQQPVCWTSSLRTVCRGEENSRCEQIRWIYFRNLSSSLNPNNHSHAKFPHGGGCKLCKSVSQTGRKSPSAVWMFLGMCVLVQASHRSHEPRMCQVLPSLSAY